MQPGFTGYCAKALSHACVCTFTLTCTTFQRQHTHSYTDVVCSTVLNNVLAEAGGDCWCWSSELMTYPCGGQSGIKGKRHEICELKKCDAHDSSEEKVENTFLAVNSVFCVCGTETVHRVLQKGERRSREKADTLKKTPNQRRNEAFVLTGTAVLELILNSEVTSQTKALPSFPFKLSKYSEFGKRSLYGQLPKQQNTREGFAHTCQASVKGMFVVNS